jgi:hypothetical protein
MGESQDVIIEGKHAIVLIHRLRNDDLKIHFDHCALPRFERRGERNDQQAVIQVKLGRGVLSTHAQV